MFRILTRFREIGISGFQHGILVAVSKLALYGSVALLALFFLFQGSFETILIWDKGHR